MRSQLNNSTKEERLPKCAGGYVSSDLKAYLDEELSPIRGWYVRRHIARCRACDEEIQWLQRLGKNMRMLENAHPRPELRARILATLPAMELDTAMSAHATGAGLPLYRRSELRYAIGGALCMLLLVSAFAALRGRGSATAVADPSSNISVRSTHRGDSVTAPVTQAQSASSPNAPISHPVIPPDPTSMLADKLYAAELVKEKADAARRLPDEWEQAIASVQNASEVDKHGAQPYVQVALDVQSVAVAQKRLVDWARSAKATALVLPGEGKTYGRVSVAVTMPAAYGTALLSKIRNMGEIVGLTTAGINKGPQWNVRPAAPVGSQPPAIVGTTKQPQVGGQPKASAGANRVAATPAGGKPSPAVAITVVVTLSSSEEFGRNR